MLSRWQRAIFIVVSAAVWAQAPGRHPATGRVFAGVMGPGGARWLERAEREREERPKLAVQLLDLKPGMKAADIGAGTGYYTELMAQEVGTEGRVFATDIQKEMLALLRRRVTEKRLANVEVVEGTAEDPRLPAGALDLALMVDVYHELAQPQAMLRKIRESLKPGGRLALIEFRKEDPNVPIREEHKMSVAEARAEVEPEGFKLETVLHDLPWQHILIFRR